MNKWLTEKIDNLSVDFSVKPKIQDPKSPGNTVQVTSGSYVKDWCFTWFIRNEKEPEKVPFHDQEMNYMIYQGERCPKTSKIHWQGYIEFKRRLRMKNVKEILGNNNIHLEPRKGTRQQANDYCCNRKKEGCILDWPVFKEGDFTAGGQGKRTDLAEACRILKETKDMALVKEHCPTAYVKFHRGFEMLNKPDKIRKSKPEVWVIYGKTGLGKTELAKKILPEWDKPNLVYWKPDDTEWWPDYNGQEEILWDDFRPSIRTPCKLLLRLLDRNPYQVQNKGGYIQFLGKKIVITSPTHPKTWYGEKEDADGNDECHQLMRRIDYVIKFTALGVFHAEDLSQWKQ